MREPKLGEMVLIENKDKKRIYWQKGIVVKKHKGIYDDVVRSVDLRVTSRNGTIIIDRALDSIYPLEMQIADPGVVMPKTSRPTAGVRSILCVISERD